MRRILLVAHRELREGLRQTWLVVDLAAVLVVISGAAIGLLYITDWIGADPVRGKDLAYWTDVLGMKLENPAEVLSSTVVLMLQALVFNQLMSMTAVMAGHAGIHDRQCGTLPFLLLAPISRFELLAGKVLGSLSVPLLLYVAIGSTASVLASFHPSAASSASYLPPSTGWLATFLISAPVWSLLTGTICVLVSAVARDVRTAQQAAWAVVFFATFLLSPLMVGLMPAGAVAQLVFSAVGAVLSVLLLVVGSWRIGRDLSR